MSSRVIILEGPDGGGKSTLAKVLNQVYGYRVVKTNAPGPNEDLFISYTEGLVSALESHIPVVFDRHWLGERVYGPLLRGKDSLGDHGRDLIERMIAARGVKVVLCLPSWKNNLHGWRSKNGNDLLQDPSQLEAVRGQYFHEAERLNEKGVDVQLFAFESHEDAEAVFLRMLRPTPSLPRGVTGYRPAEYLIVGEQVNPKVSAWDLTFHDLEASSLYMYDHLKATGINEEKVAWMNARDIRGNLNHGVLHDALEAMPNVKRIVCLGQVASDYVRVELKDIGTIEGLNPGLSTRTLPHPQYWRRFQNRHWDDYQRQLQEALEV